MDKNIRIKDIHISWERLAGKIYCQKFCGTINSDTDSVWTVLNSSSAIHEPWSFVFYISQGHWKKAAQPFPTSVFST
jgi:hypothetical protein